MKDYVLALALYLSCSAIVRFAVQLHSYHLRSDAYQILIYARCVTFCKQSFVGVLEARMNTHPSGGGLFQRISWEYKLPTSTQHKPLHPTVNQ